MVVRGGTAAAVGQQGWQDRRDGSERRDGSDDSTSGDGSERTDCRLAHHDGFKIAYAPKMAILQKKRKKQNARAEVSFAIQKVPQQPRIVTERQGHADSVCLPTCSTIRCFCCNGACCIRVAFVSFCCVLFRVASYPILLPNYSHTRVHTHARIHVGKLSHWLETLEAADSVKAETLRTLAIS